MQVMCPHCGETFDGCSSALIPVHVMKLSPGQDVVFRKTAIQYRINCPGSGQIPRNPESDKRPLWKDGEVS